MKLSFQWLKKYVALPDTLTMEQLSYDLTMRTVEVEGTTDLQERYAHIVAGRILSVKPHPNADRLRVCMVDVGLDEPKQIVCGGANLEEGHDVVVTLPGSHAIWHGEGEPMLIEEAELRGVSSFGMIAGAAEVGLEFLFPAHEPHTIIDLTDWGIDRETEVRPGKPIADILGLNDQILEIENKSITNRPDLWGHYGVARELAAIYHLPLHPLPTFVRPDVESYPLTLEATDLCRRFLAAQYVGVDSRPAPLWMRVALMKVDIRPINALVDLTNYVMMSVGQPTHAYDAQHLKGGIQARRAAEGETLELLDGKQLTLSPADLVIADQEKALGLAGVMGGKQDSILSSTTETVFEAAAFRPESIRKTAQTFGLRTEASSRNEKGIDAQRVEPAFALWDQMLHELFPEARLTAFSLEDAALTERAVVNVSVEWLVRRLGRELNVDEVRQFLLPLGFDVEEEPSEGETLLHVLAPTWRSTGDISLPDDILEEIARMIGYENFTMKAPVVKLDHAVNQGPFSLERRLLEYLAFTCGFQEITSYPWVNEQMAEISGVKEEDMIRLDQPPAPEQSGLRTTHIPNLLDAVVKNIRYFDSFRIFEVGQVYQKGAMSPSSPDEVLPAMHRELAGCIVGSDPASLFYEVKGALEGIGTACQTAEFHFAQHDKPVWADINGWLTIETDGKEVGCMGLLSHRAKAGAGIKHHDVCLFAINLESLKVFDSRSNQFTPLPLYPHVFQDLSLLADESLTWKEMQQAVASYVDHVSFVDEYRGKQIPEGKKSVTLRFELGSEEKTLSAEEIEEKMSSVRAALRKVGAEVRDA